MRLSIDTFSGLAPRLAAHLLPDGAAVVAENCRLMSGSVASWNAPLLAHTPNPPSTWPPYQTIYRYQPLSWRPLDLAYYLTWLSEVQVVASPVANDRYSRIYYTGDGYPMVLSEDGAGTGTAYRVGVPAPTAAPVLTVTGTPVPFPVTDLTTGIDRVAVLTFVNTYGEESAPSPVSDTLTAYPGQTWHLELVDYTVAEPYQSEYRPLQEKRLYLSNTGSSGTEFQFVAALSPDATSYDVPYAFTAYGEVLGTTGWLPPPADLVGLVTLPWGALAGFRPASSGAGAGNQVYLSMPYQPHAWPEEYAFTVSDPLVALASFGNTLLALTEGFPTVATGTDPAALSIERLEEGFSCTSRRGVVDLGGMILYPCPQGLAYVSTSGSGLATEKMLTAREWALFYPSTVAGHHYNGNYVGFFDSSYGHSEETPYVETDYVEDDYVEASSDLSDGYMEDGYIDAGYFEGESTWSQYGYEDPRASGAVRGGFVFHLASGQLSTLTGEYTAGHSYNGGARLLLHSYPSGDLVLFDEGVTRLATAWQSKTYLTASDFHPTALRVYADSYPLTLKLYENETLAATVSVTSDTPQRLPFGLKGRKWQVRLEGTSEVKSVTLATSIEELGQ